MALLKRCIHLFSRIELPAAVGTAPAPVNKNLKHPSARGPAERKSETTFSPRGDSRSTADRRTDYEVAEGPKEIRRHLGIGPDTHRLDKKGVWGLPSAFW